MNDMAGLSVTWLWIWGFVGARAVFGREKLDDGEHVFF